VLVAAAVLPYRTKYIFECVVAVLVVTNWDEFNALDEEYNRMTRPVVIDDRRIDIPDRITYEGLTQ